MEEVRLPGGPTGPGLVLPPSRTDPPVTAADLSRDQSRRSNKDQKSAELGKHLCEARDQKYWRLPSMKITQISELLPAHWQPAAASTS